MGSKNVSSRNLMSFLWAFYNSNQLIRDIRAFDAQDAFLGTAIAQKIDAAIPDNFLIDDSKFLVNVWPENNIYSIVLEHLQYPLQSKSVFGFKFLCWPGHSNCADAFCLGNFQVLCHLRGASSSHEGTDDQNFFFSTCDIIAEDW